MEPDNSTINPNRIYTLDEVAKLFMLHHPRYLKPYLDSGSITTARVGKRLFISGQSILAFVNTHSMAASSEQQPTDSQPTGVQQQAQPEPEPEWSDTERWNVVLRVITETAVRNQPQPEKVAAKLNEIGVLNKRGNPWSVADVHRAIKTAPAMPWLVRTSRLTPTTPKHWQQPTDSQPTSVQQQAQSEQEPQQPTDSQPAGVQQKAQPVGDDERYAAALALADAGLSNSAIAAKLTLDGVPTARGGAWTADAARRTVLTARKMRDSG